MPEQPSRRPRPGGGGRPPGGSGRSPGRPTGRPGGRSAGNGAPADRGPGRSSGPPAFRGPGRASGGAGRPTGRPGAGSGRSAGGYKGGGYKGGVQRAGGQRAGGYRAGGDGRGRSEGRRDGRSEHPARAEPVFRTEAERRSAEVRARRGPKVVRPPVDPQHELEQWVDEGPIREEAIAAAKRGATAAPTAVRRRRAPLDPDIAIQISEQAGGSRRAQPLISRFSMAADALERDRIEEARRLVGPLVKEIPGVAAVRMLAGLVSYRMGRWKQAITQLEAGRALGAGVEHLPVLADSYRALRRWDDVERCWRELREASPAPSIMAEGRIVAAGALADRGDLRGALALMSRAGATPKRVRDYHIRQWYVLGDLHDRAGDVLDARRYFGLVAAHDPDFVDVRERLRAVGR